MTTQHNGNPWLRSHRAHALPRDVADRHYSRQTIGAKQFVPPGRCVVLYAENRGGKAYWVTSWPYAEYTKHAWPGAWMCSAFRNKGVALSSLLIRQAVAVTRSVWEEPPEIGMITFVNEAKAAKKANPGWCFICAGFAPCGRTKGGLLALRLAPGDMPDAEAARGITP